MPRALTLDGQIFGRLAVVERRGSGGGKALWLCACTCGTQVTIPAGALRSGNTTSCGCLVRDLGRQRLTQPELNPVRRLHGHSLKGAKTPEYRAWLNAKSRCLNPNMTGYEHWGGRGITMCAEWIDSFETFLRDIGPRPSAAHTIDRINVNTGYEPGNVRWTTWKEQAINKRRVGRKRKIA